jgi:hypothetical protein
MRLEEENECKQCKKMLNAELLNVSVKILLRQHKKLLRPQFSAKTAKFSAESRRRAASQHFLS